MFNSLDKNARQTGAVVVFRPGITPEQAQKLLETLCGKLELEYFDSPQEFNPTYGQPCFYVP